jgi:hypothetical protein
VGLDHRFVVTTLGCFKNREALKSSLSKGGSLVRYRATSKAVRPAEFISAVNKNERSADCPSSWGFRRLVYSNGQNFAILIIINYFDPSRVRFAPATGRRPPLQLSEVRCKSCANFPLLLEKRLVAQKTLVKILTRSNRPSIARRFEAHGFEYYRHGTLSPRKSSSPGTAFLHWAMRMTFRNSPGRDERNSVS